LPFSELLQTCFVAVSRRTLACKRGSTRLIWIPDFEANVNPAYGSPWQSPLVPPGDEGARNNDALLNNRSNAAGDRVLQTKRPDWTHPSDHQIAARLDIASGALT